MKTLEKRIVGSLLSSGNLSEADLERALTIWDGSVSLHEMLVSQGYVEPGAIARALAEANGFQYLDLKEIRLSPSALERLSAEDAWKYEALPIWVEENCLTIAVADPSNVLIQDDLRRKLKCAVILVVAHQQDLLDTIRLHYGPSPSVGDHLSREEIATIHLEEEREKNDSKFDLEEEDPATARQRHRELQRERRQSNSRDRISKLRTQFLETNQEELRLIEQKRLDRGAYEEPRDSNEVRKLLLDEEHRPLALLRELLNLAVSAGAEEMELTPLLHAMRVRMRRRSMWRRLPAYPMEGHQEVINHLRQMAGLDLKARDVSTEHQLFVPSHRGEMLCTLHLENTTTGERAVIRFSENTPLLGNPLLAAGLPTEKLAQVTGRLDRRSGGLLFLSSPSARTPKHYYQSLMRCLSQSGQRDILSLERPHDRRLPGVSSINCPNEDVLMASLANASFMNPDVIGIDSVENGTVLNRVVNVAIRGTTCIAAFTAPDSATAQDCFRAAQLDPMNILRGVIGHLHVEDAPALCEKCHKPLEDRSDLPDWAKELHVDMYEAAGCEACEQTGYDGIVTLAEYLEPDREKGDGRFTTIVARDRDLVSATVAGRIDPREYPG